MFGGFDLICAGSRCCVELDDALLMVYCEISGPRHLGHDCAIHNAMRSSVVGQEKLPQGAEIKLI